MKYLIYAVFVLLLTAFSDEVFANKDKSCEGVFNEVMRTKLNQELLTALAQGDMKKSLLVLSAGADVSAKDEHGNTALHWALKSKLMPVAHFLIARGADMNARDEHNNTALILAGFIGFSPTVQLMLRSQSIDLNATNQEGLTALMYAAWLGNRPIVKMLKDSGADVSIKSNKGWTAWRLAVWEGHTKLAHDLLKPSAK